MDRDGGVKRLLALLGLVLAAPAAAEAPWHGVWHGTIGTLAVRVCLADRGTWANGSYYYLSKLRAIPLDREADGRWPRAWQAPPPRRA